MAFAHNTLVDPLAGFLTGAVDGAQHPVPLISTRFDVTLAGALAVVSAIRVFRNSEAKSIEATITLPVPVHAQVFGLSARIGERTLNAVAKAKAEARETYEDAIDRGKAAVLHEEALRGVHVLSVAHVAPGEEIEVKIQWVESLRAAGERLKLRIPTTVGEIYGRSPLVELDDLLTGGGVQAAQLSIASEGPVWLGRTLVEGGRASAPLDQPIDLSIPAALPRSLVGLAADGRRVNLTFSASSGDEPLDLAILVDRSGSMDTACSAGGARTKHQAVVEGLSATRLGATDRIRLWQFDNHAQMVGEAQGTGLRRLAARLGPPQGGTEIGLAIGAVIESCKVADILVITDGQSHALDVQALARLGRRINVVLIGEDSLEARIGHLAALTGGEIFVASEADIPAVIHAAFAALRGGAATTTGGEALGVRRAGVMIKVVSKAIETEHSHTPEMERAVGAFAACLQLSNLTEPEAARLALREGLVTHLTSLVLVDEAGATQEDLPAQRKVALPEPAVFASGAVYRRFGAPSVVDMVNCLADEPEPNDHDLERPSFLRRLSIAQLPVASSEDSRLGWRSLWGRIRRSPKRRTDGLPLWLTQIDWAAHGGELAAGDYKSLSPRSADALSSISKTAWAIEKALSFGMTPLIFVILAAALAAEAGSDRAAGRVARRLLGGRPRSELPPVSELLVQLIAG